MTLDVEKVRKYLQDGAASYFAAADRTADDSGRAFYRGCATIYWEMLEALQAGEFNQQDRKDGDDGD